MDLCLVTQVVSALCVPPPGSFAHVGVCHAISFSILKGYKLSMFNFTLNIYFTYFKIFIL